MRAGIGRAGQSNPFLVSLASPTKFRLRLLGSPGLAALAAQCRRTLFPASGPAYISSSAVQYFFLCGELQNEVRIAFRRRLASASGIQPVSLARVLGRRSPAADDRPGSTPRRILLATPDAEIPSGVRIALRIRSISASCMRTSMPHPCYERMNDIWSVGAEMRLSRSSQLSGTGAFDPRLNAVSGSGARRPRTGRVNRPVEFHHWPLVARVSRSRKQLRHRRPVPLQALD